MRPVALAGDRGSDGGPGGRGGRSPAPKIQNTLTQINLMDRDAVFQAARKSRDAEIWINDMIRQNIYRWRAS